MYANIGSTSSMNDNTPANNLEKSPFNNTLDRVPFKLTLPSKKRSPIVTYNQSQPHNKWEDYATSQLTKALGLPLAS
jgi:hypothetical protein